MNKQIRLLYKTCFAIFILSLIGCDSSHEKSLEYYLEHPDEMRSDYRRCQETPGQVFCFGIERKYFQFQRHAHNKNANFAEIDSHTNYIDIDEIIESNNDPKNFG